MLNPTQFGVLLGIVSGLVGVIGVYFLAKSNARENARQRLDAIEDAVKAATQEQRARHQLEVQQLRDQLQAAREQSTTANQQILRRDRMLERAQTRVEELEDELRRAR